MPVPDQPTASTPGSPTPPEGSVPRSTSTAATDAAQACAATVIQWQGYQRPSEDGSIVTDSISTTSAPIDPPSGAGSPVLRFELGPDEKFDSSGYIASRAEVYGRQAVPASTTPADEWPDPAGSTRWYQFDVFLPEDFPTATDTSWLVLAQWKGLHGGSPPIAIEVNRDRLRLGGARANQGLVPNGGDLGTIDRGAWTRLQVGLTFSTTSATGGVEVWRDGVPVLDRLPLATLDLVDGITDPVYLKIGLYRDPNWETTHVAYFSPVLVTSGARNSLCVDEP